MGQSVPTTDPIHSLICDAFFATEESHNILQQQLAEGCTSTYITLAVKNRKDPRFTQAKIEEIDKLVKMGTYEIVQEAAIPRKGTILQSRFVLTIKDSGEKTEYFKARLVILGHIDPEKPRVVNEAPTVLKSSIRLTLSLIAAYDFTIWSRDITLAFLQSKDALKRTVYVRPPKGENVLAHIGAPPGSILKAIKPQYGLAESPG